MPKRGDEAAGAQLKLVHTVGGQKHCASPKGAHQVDSGPLAAGSGGRPSLQVDGAEFPCTFPQPQVDWRSLDASGCRE
jgi:hypothetical protein